MRHVVGCMGIVLIAAALYQWLGWPIVAVIVGLCLIAAADEL